MIFDENEAERHVKVRKVLPPDRVGGLAMDRRD